jgi:hypothetical protein
MLATRLRATIGSEKNYWGDNSDGDVTISSDTELTSVTDSDIIVKNYKNLTINIAQTLTVSNRCKGLFIYCSGDLTVNGTLSMTARGANADPVADGVGANGLRLPMFTLTGTDTLAAADFAGCGAAVIAAVANQNGISGDGTIVQVKRAGAAGESAVTGNDEVAGGTDGGTGESGGGGAGGSWGAGGVSGAGAAGTCWSGGPGGGAHIGNSTGGPASDGTANGGAGGAAKEGGGATGQDATGGAGNPGGAGDGANSIAGNDGTGGLLILLVKGDVTVGPYGSIECNGARSGNVVASVGASGGSSGGS